MRFYLSNALGFFIQMAPCAFMVYLPFPEEGLRFSRKLVLLWTGILVGVLAALFPIPLLYLTDLEDRGDLAMMVAIALVLGGYFFLVRETAIKKILSFFVVLFYAVAQYWIVNAVWNFLPYEDYWEFGPYPPLTTLLYAFSAALTMPVMLRYAVRPLGEFLREMEPQEMRREFAIAMVSTTAFIAVLMVINLSGPFPQQLSVMLMELLLMLQQMLLYWLVFQESIRRKRDAERRRALEIQKLQYDKISREMENTRRLRHDVRHHLNAVGALNAQGKREEIAAYLKQYGAVVDRLDEMKFSGDPVVDGVLAYYLTQAEELSAEVDCEASLGRDTGVEATDMTVLLGNLLENALEALGRLPEDRRRLFVELRSARSMLLLRIRNTCAEAGDSGEPTGWEAFADSGGSARRGVGLSSVSAIADKYNGSAVFQRRDGVFTTRVILNPRQSQFSKEDLL